MKNPTKFLVGNRIMLVGNTECVEVEDILQNKTYYINLKKFKKLLKTLDQTLDSN